MNRRPTSIAAPLRRGQLSRGRWRPDSDDTDWQELAVTTFLCSEARDGAITCVCCTSVTQGSLPPCQRFHTTFVKARHEHFQLREVVL